MTLQELGASPKFEDAFYKWLDTPSAEILKMDMRRWGENIYPEAIKSNYRHLFSRLVSDYNEFLSLAEYRMKKGGFDSEVGPLLPRFPRPPGLSIAGDIGPGFFIQHGHGTRVNVRSAGVNLWVLHGVTIGHKGEGKPTIGDNVYIATGAVVVGGITIGNNARIFANAVVDFDVPDFAKVYAPRSYIVKGD